MLTRRRRQRKVRAIDQSVQVDPSLLLRSRISLSGQSSMTVGFVVTEGFGVTHDMAATKLVPKDVNLVSLAVFTNDADIMGVGGIIANVAAGRNAQLGCANRVGCFDNTAEVQVALRLRSSAFERQQCQKRHTCGANRASGRKAASWSSQASALYNNVEVG